MDAEQLKKDLNDAIGDVAKATQIAAELAKLSKTPTKQAPSSNNTNGKSNSNFSNNDKSPALPIRDNETKPQKPVVPPRSYPSSSSNSNEPTQQTMSPLMKSMPASTSSSGSRPLPLPRKTNPEEGTQKPPEPLPRIPTSPKPEGVTIKPQTSPRRTNQSVIVDSMQTLDGTPTPKSRELKKSNSSDFLTTEISSSSENNVPSKSPKPSRPPRPNRSGSVSEGDRTSYSETMNSALASNPPFSAPPPVPRSSEPKKEEPARKKSLPENNSSFQDSTQSLSENSSQTPTTRKRSNSLKELFGSLRTKSKEDLKDTKDSNEGGESTEISNTNQTPSNSGNSVKNAILKTFNQTKTFSSNALTAIKDKTVALKDDIMRKKEEVNLCFHLNIKKSKFKAERAEYSMRVKTFANWPHQNPTPEKLAEAGFYYTPKGDQNDRCKCFSCDLKIYGWSADDDPKVEHKKFRKNCKHIISLNIPDDLSVSSDSSDTQSKSKSGGGSFFKGLIASGKEKTMRKQKPEVKTRQELEKFQSFVNKQDKFKDKSAEERKAKAREYLIGAQTSLKEMEKVLSFYASDPSQMEKVEGDIQALQNVIEKLASEAEGGGENSEENKATGNQKGDWIEYATTDGNKYWYNSSSGETSWEEPNI